MGDKKNVVYFTDRIPGWDKNNFYDLYDTFKTVLANDDPRYMTQSDGGMPLNLLPTRKFSIPVDPRQALNSGIVHPGDHVVPQPAPRYRSLEKSAAKKRADHAGHYRRQ